MKMILLLGSLALTTIGCQDDVLSARDRQDPRRFAGNWKQTVYFGDRFPIRLSPGQELHARWMRIDPDDSIPIAFTDSVKTYSFNPAQVVWGPDFTWSVAHSELRAVEFRREFMVAYLPYTAYPFTLYLSEDGNALSDASDPARLVVYRRGGNQ